MSSPNKIAHDDLVEQLSKHGYHKSKYTEGLFIHETRQIAFTLVVDDFAIKYIDKADVDHLLMCLQEECPVKVDWDSQQYIGINFTWNYGGDEVLLNMKDYVNQALKQFNHPTPKQFHYGPSKVDLIKIGAKIQYSPDIDNRPISEIEHEYIQQVTGKFLFHHAPCAQLHCMWWSYTSKSSTM